MAGGEEEKGPQLQEQKLGREVPDGAANSKGEYYINLCL